MAEAPIAARDHEFQVQVIANLATLNEWAKGISEHLKKLNGSVARHEQAIAEMQAAAKTSAGWRKALSPPLWVLVGLIIAVLLLHGPQLASAVK